MGFGNFSSLGENDMILRNVNTGGVEVYDINNNQITGAAFLGTIGLEWQFAGIAPIHAAGTSDLVLRNVNTGVFEVYDIANNQITGAAPLGQVGLGWQLGGFAADPPSGSMGSSDSASQLVQAMAGFGGGSGAGDTANTVALGADRSVIEITHECEKPNGIALSPDEKTLYVADHNSGSDRVEVKGAETKPGAMKLYAASVVSSDSFRLATALAASMRA